MSDTLVPEAPSVAAVTEGVLGFRDLLAAASGTDWSRLDSAGVADLLDAVEELTACCPPSSAQRWSARCLIVAWLRMRGVGRR